MNVEQLRAFVTVVDAGSMDAAARRLHITPSAVSQRIRALETAAGSVLLNRTSPPEPTEAGGIVLSAARQILMLEADARARLAGGSGGSGHGLGGRTERQTLRLAVNADSLATWLEPLLGIAAGWTDALLHLQVCDQAEADGLLSAGRAMAAISSRRPAPPGCSSTELGVMRYTAMATGEAVAGPGAGAPPQPGSETVAGPGADAPAPPGSETVAEAAPGGSAAPADLLRRVPMVEFGTDDDLQRALLRRYGVRTPPPAHQVPGSRESVLAVRAGLGWGMVPDLQLDEPEEELVVLPVPDPVIAVPLYLHRWKIGTPRLDRACEAIQELARERLRCGEARPGSRQRRRVW